MGCRGWSHPGVLLVIVRRGFRITPSQERNAAALITGIFQALIEAPEIKFGRNG